MNENWEVIRKLFKEKLGMPEYIADYIAVWDVLMMTLSGLSIEIIERDTLLNERDIKDILNEFFAFDGWEKIQHVNYWFIFNQTDSKESFSKIIQNLSEYGIINIDVEKVYSMCQELSRIRKELNDWYH